MSVSPEQDSTDPAERLLDACRRYWAWALSHRTQGHRVPSRQRRSFAPWPATVELAWASFGDLVARVREARPDLVGDEVEDAAHHLWAMLHGYVMLEALLPVGADETEGARRFERGVLAMLRTDAGSRA